MGGHIHAKKCVQHQEKSHALGIWFKIKHFVSVFMPVYTLIDAIRERKGTCGRELDTGRISHLLLTTDWNVSGVQT